MAIAVVQAFQDPPTQELDASVTIAYASSPTQGNLLIAVCRGTTVIGNASITGWTLAQSALFGTALTLGLWYKIAGAGESSNVTINWTSSTSTSITIAEYSGVDGTTPLDKIAKTDHTGSVTSKSSGTTATTARDASLAVAVFSMGNSVTSPSYSNSFTKVADPFALDFNTATKTVNIGAQECTCSWTTSRFAGALIAVFQPSVGGGPFFRVRGIVG